MAKEHDGTSEAGDVKEGKAEMKPRYKQKSESPPSIFPLLFRDDSPAALWLHYLQSDGGS